MYTAKVYRDDTVVEVYRTEYWSELPMKFHPFASQLRKGDHFVAMLDGDTVSVARFHF